MIGVDALARRPAQIPRHRHRPFGMEQRPARVGVHVREVEIEVAVVVVVAPGDAHRGAARSSASARAADVAERAVALVVVERADAELVADVEVGPTVVVVVAPGCRRGPSRVSCDAGRLASTSRERAVAVVVVEAVGRAVVRVPVGQRRRVLVVAHAHDEDVEPAVAVVVGDDRHARPDARADAGGVGRRR